MTRRLTLATLALPVALLGCNDASTEQIWAFYLGAAIVDSDSTNLSHNFNGAYEPSDSSDWSQSGDVLESDGLIYGEMVDLANGEQLLVIGGETYLGATVETTTTWSWDHYSEGDSYDSHSAGYAFTQDWSDHTLDQIALNEGDTDGVLTGTWTTTVSTDDFYAEDDTWDTTLTGQANSRIPVSSWLVVEDDFGNESAASNSPVDTDCSGDPCSLSVSTKVVVSRTVKAVETDYTADELDRNLEISGQQAGHP